MGEKLYLVGHTCSGDQFVCEAKFGELSNALIFAEAYFEKYDKEPNMSLTIMRVDKERVIEHARDT